MAHEGSRPVVRRVVLEALGPASEREAARYFSSDGAIVGVVLEPKGEVDAGEFRDAVWLEAMEMAAEPGATPVGGIVFRARWGGGGIAVT
jgi:hypothetical protein